MHMIDLRSDTVTLPTQEMRDAMHTARVGDDVYSDDPTVNRLEELAAEILGKEAAMYVSSGTQGNAVCILAHARPGDAVLLDPGCHVATHENGSYAMLAGLSPYFWKSDQGVPDYDSFLEQLVQVDDVHIPPTGLVCLENACSSGNVIPLDLMDCMYRAAREHSIPVHLDGARLFNAALSLGVDIKELTSCCDTVMCCLSKGLCAPIGSVVAGPKTIIDRARRMRKILGGGMRQAGILAAAGILALTQMPERLKEDHDNARYMADALDRIPGITVNRKTQKINMVWFSVQWPKEAIDAFPAHMLEQNIKIGGYSGGAFRWVTNNDVSRQDVDTAVQALVAYTKANS